MYAVRKVLGGLQEKEGTLKSLAAKLQKIVHFKILGFNVGEVFMLF